MSGSLPKRLLRLSDAADYPLLSGTEAAAYPKAALDRLLSCRVLVELEPASEWPVCKACECDLEARPIQRINGKIVAPCPLDRQADADLTEDDLRSFRVDPGALAQQIASDSGFPDAPAEIVPGVWHLGLTPAGRAAFLVLSLAQIQQPGIVALLRSAVRSAPITVIGPPLPMPESLRFEEVGIHLVAVGDVVGVGNGAACFALDLSRLVPAADLKPRLIIVQWSKTVILDGTERLLPLQPYRLLLLLAEKARIGDGIVLTQEIESHTGREARDIVRELRNALAEGSPSPGAIRNLIRNRRSRSAYQLVLAAMEIDLRP